MTVGQIIEMQKSIGVAADSFWGPKSDAACKKYLRAMMPKPNPWPKADQASMEAFYGKAGHVELAKVALPFRTMLYDGPSTIGNITCHVKVARSLERVLDNVKKMYPTVEDRAEAGIDRFFGSYVVRPMRTGKAWSKHAWGVALDFDANRNGLYTHWPTRARMPLGIMECFAREGWTNLGWLINRDAMHAEAVCYT